ASNNWAVAPSRTASKHALLAGDPHLDLTLPSIWYEVHLVVPGTLDVYGVTIPGAAAIVIGFNRDVAWTFTNTGADVLDYYAEQIDDPAHPTKYRVDGAWRPLEQRVERYRDARGGLVATDTLYFTHRGPMRHVRGRWLSMRWTVLEGGREINAFHDAAHARSARELEDLMAASYLAPAQNMLAADRGGHIVIRSTGRFPVRAGDGDGATVRDGTLSASDWTGAVPVERYPQSFDPAQGFLASANQQPIDPAGSHDWWGGSYDPWRAMRINTLLRADSSVTPDAMRRYQTDPGSERANFFVPLFLAAARRAVARGSGASAASDIAEGARLLGEWDRRYTRENRRAVLFEAALRILTERTWDELLESNAPGARRAATPSSDVLAALTRDSTSVWWDDHRTAGREDRDDLLAESLGAAVQELRKRLGSPDGIGWRWDHVRFATVNHLLRLDALGVRDIPVQGGTGTLAPSSGTGTHSSSWRMVVELGPDIKAWATYPGGQSGNPFSDRYRDRLPQWSAGELSPVRFPASPDALTPAMRSATLLLRSQR
nr:penicillin acylase family protein [Gemmatimonadaceae bacterium]